jgi:2-polyprenyl-3-methyl-5-hydroxy-6-metoxy-1,4-benzoquinol methylase
MKTNSELVRKGYTKIAEAYHKQRTRYASKTLLNRFSKFIPKKSKILDVGSGAGVPVAKFLSEKGYKVTGIDFAEEMVKLAKKNVPEADFIKMDMTKMKFKPNTFDGAVSFYAIIHIPKEKHIKVYQVLHKIIKPKGIILFNTGGTETEEYQVRNYLGVPMFWGYWNPKKTLQIIKSARFEIIWSKVLKIGGETSFWVLARNKK